MFKYGDQISCIDNKDVKSYLELGKIYKFECYDTDNRLYIEGFPQISFDAKKFKLVYEMFNSGDKIRCINNLNVEKYLELGKIYIFECYLNDNCLRIKEFPKLYLDIKRFELVKEFKSGDKIRCIDNKDLNSLLELGKIYTFNGYDGSDHLTIKENSKYFFDAERFEAVEENKTKEETKMFNPGDKVRCIDNKWYEKFLELNKIYTVKDVDKKFLFFKEDEITKRYERGYFDWRFELVEENEVKDDKSEGQKKEEKYFVIDINVCKIFSSKEDAYQFWLGVYSKNGDKNNETDFNRKGYLCKVVSEIKPETQTLTYWKLNDV